MSDEAVAPEIQINIKGPNELKLQISITTDKTVLELKQAIAAKSDVEAGRQRLIYSGRVLKDDDTLATYKIQASHTIHMVKGAARASGSTSQQSSTPQQLPTMQAGQNPHDPLTQLNSHLGYGALAGFNPFADLGVNTNDPNMFTSMMNSPQFLQQMSSMMSNPAIIDQVIASNPQLAGMGPQVRAAMQSEQFRELISNPERLRQMLQMAHAFQGASGLGAGGPFGSPFGAPPFGFPAPGAPNTTGTNANNTNPAGGNATGTNATPPPFNLFAPPPTGAAGAGGAGSPPPLDPSALFGMNPFGFGLPPVAPTPSDTRPPEERFQVQLQQLQDMGFTNASQNVRALLATGGNVHSAIEYILNGGGL
ncbi:hypothetical protein AX16_004361 [Volvariella volvacea WC 439]|nr:hypothetical protein AX16_004361 [Volvariella volvacea WC 439]